MLRKILYQDENVKWLFFGRDPSKHDDVVDTNQYLIVSQDEALILDPGGTEIFPSMLTATSNEIDLLRIKAYLCSHQDPDIMSSLPLWMALTPHAKIYLSWLWGGFVSHFGHEYSKNFVHLMDEGMKIELGSCHFQIVPAHHCHSPGNFNLYDPRSKILFSGDMGAALVPEGYGIFVENFDTHTQYMEKFHLRWMPSNAAKNAWIKRVRKLDIEMICPQHGAIFRGEDVKRFLNWLEELNIDAYHKEVA